VPAGVPPVPPPVVPPVLVRPPVPVIVVPPPPVVVVPPVPVVVEPPMPLVVEPPAPESLLMTLLLPQAAMPADSRKNARGRSAAEIFFVDAVIGNLLPARRSRR
jgi:hypothetical protein